MWILTTKGLAVNLAQASRLEVVTGRERYDVDAEFDGRIETLASKPTFEEAAATLRQVLLAHSHCMRFYDLPLAIENQSKGEQPCPTSLP